MVAFRVVKVSWYRRNRFGPKMCSSRSQLDVSFNMFYYRLLLLLRIYAVWLVGQSLGAEHAENAETSLGPVEVFTWRRPHCVSNFKKFNLRLELDQHVFAVVVGLVNPFFLTHIHTVQQLATSWLTLLYLVKHTHVSPHMLVDDKNIF